MGQDLVYGLLRKNGKWMNNHEIASAANITYSAASTATRKLYNSDFLFMKPIRQFKHGNRVVFYFKAKVKNNRRRN